MAFDKELAQAIVDRAIEQMKGSKTVAAKVEADVLYRMGMVGVMASFIAQDLPVPAAVNAAVIRGQRMSKKRWKQVLGGDGG